MISYRGKDILESESCPKHYGQEYFDVLKSGKVIARMYPVERVKPGYFEDTCEYEDERSAELQRINRARLILQRKSVGYSVIGNWYVDNGNINQLAMGIKCIERSHELPSIVGPFVQMNRTSIEKELSVFPKAEKNTREKSTAVKHIGNISDFYTDRTSYIRSKQTGYKAITSCESSKYGTARRGSVNCEQDELLSLATTDCIINVLEAGERYISSPFADKCDGVDFTHISDNVGYCRNAYNNAISNLSRTWKAAKRPKSQDAINPDIAGIDPVELVAANTFFARKEEKISVINRTSGKTIDGISVMVTDSDFHKKARKLLSGIELAVFDMKMNGYKESEIASEMGCNIRKVGRIMVKIRNAIEPIASDLSDYVQRQAGTPAYSW